MKHSIQIPSVGESITEVFLGTWKKKSGDIVSKGETLLEIETQKSNFELEAQASGRLEIIHTEAGKKVPVGEIIAYIDDSVSAGSAKSEDVTHALTNSSQPLLETRPDLSPAVRKMVVEKKIEPSAIQGLGKGGRLLKSDVLQSLTEPVSLPGRDNPRIVPTVRADTVRGDKIEKASRIRLQIAENLVRAQHTAAILTTFNEIDMTSLLSLRNKYKEDFKKKYGTGLGMVGFFAMACAKALKKYPLVNAMFTGDSIITRPYFDLSIAVSTERGLVVPVMRDVDKMNLARFEQKLAELSQKAKDGKLSIPEMTGGTFTITNGGVFGSLVSTPILNMPQSVILGLHKTEKRPVVKDDQIVIRDMMYVALSYDHRMIDGRDAVLFLVAVKEAIENVETLVSWKEIL